MLKRIISLFIVIFIIILYFDEELPINDEETNVQKKEQTQIETKEDGPLDINKIDGAIIELMHKSDKELMDSLGDPNRKDPTPYGFDWWVYDQLRDQYLQVGVKDKQVVTVFAIGNVKISPFQIGDSFEKVRDEFSFEQSVTYKNDQGNFHFNLTDEDLLQNPLIKLSDEVFAQLYFDTFTKELSSIRLLTGDTLLQIRPYAMEYWGSIPNQKELSSNEWNAVQVGREQQIFAITNMIRKRFDLKTLEWEETVAEVAFLHSKDMAMNEYFSHVSLNGNGLKERLAKQNIKYLSAGENIAAMYPDSPAAVEGWLNSEGHRKAMLNEAFTHLGTGVYQGYYTQNFLQKF